jgi:hypothetical protein
MAAEYNDKRTSITTVRGQYLSFTTFPTPLLSHYPLSSIFFMYRRIFSKWSANAEVYFPLSNANLFALLRIWGARKILISRLHIVRKLVHTAVYQEENALPGKIPENDNDRKKITAGIRLRQERTIQGRIFNGKAPKFYIATRGYLVPVIGSPRRSTSFTANHKTLVRVDSSRNSKRIY